MRYSEATRFDSRYCATHSLAESMNSSIRRCAMLRSERVMLFINPNSSNSMTGSGKSKSIDPRRCRLAFDHIVDGSVGHALGGADNAFAQLVTRDLASRINLHHAGKHQSVEVWTEAADVCREFERQHGDGAVWKVDAGAPQMCFLIECGIGSNILGHVGDMDLQLEMAIRESSNRHGVVEIAGGFAVDGDDGNRAEVAAMAKFLCRNHGGNILRLFQCGRGKMVRQVKFADRNFDVNAEVILPAEDFEDAPTRILCGRRPIGNLHINDHAFEVIPFGLPGNFVSEHAIDGLPAFSWRWRLAGCFYGRDLHARRYDNVVRNLAVNRLNVIVAAAVVKNSNHGRLA